MKKTYRERNGQERARLRKKNENQMANLKRERAYVRRLADVEKYTTKLEKAKANDSAASEKLIAYYQDKLLKAQNDVKMLKSKIPSVAA